MSLSCSSGGDHGAPLTPDFNVLFYSVCKGETDQVERLLKSKADVNLRGGPAQMTLLCAAATFNQIGSATLLVKMKADVNLCAHTGPSPLIVAAANGYYEIVKLLIDFLADLEIVSHNDTALMVAIYEEHPRTVGLLLASDAQTNYSYDKCSPLTLAVDSADVVVVRELLTHNADPNFIMSMPQGTAVHLAARRVRDSGGTAEQNSLTCLKCLLAYNGDPLLKVQKVAAIHLSNSKAREIITDHFFEKSPVMLWNSWNALTKKKRNDAEERVQFRKAVENLLSTDTASIDADFYSSKAAKLELMLENEVALRKEAESSLKRLQLELNREIKKLKRLEKKFRSVDRKRRQREENLKRQSEVLKEWKLNLDRIKIMLSAEKQLRHSAEREREALKRKLERKSIRLKAIAKKYNETTKQNELLGRELYTKTKIWKKERKQVTKGELKIRNELQIKNQLLGTLNSVHLEEQTEATKAKKNDSRSQNATGNNS